MVACSYSVVVPVFNAIDVASRAVEYLVESGVSAAAIRIADDGSDQESWQKLAAWSTELGCVYDRSNVNRGYTSNVNAALRKVETEYALLLNSDCFIGKTSIDALLATLEEFPALAGVGPLSNMAASQSITLKARRSWVDLTNREIAAASQFMESRLAWLFGVRPFVVPSVNGFCTLWRMSALRDVDLFDEVNFERGYGEEDDLCYRLLTEGLFCAVAPWVFAAHFKTQSFKPDEAASRKVGAKLTLVDLHGQELTAAVIRYFAAHPLFRQLSREAVDIG